MGSEMCIRDRHHSRHDDAVEDPTEIKLPEPKKIGVETDQDRDAKQQYTEDTNGDGKSGVLFLRVGLWLAEAGGQILLLRNSLSTRIKVLP